MGHLTQQLSQISQCFIYGEYGRANDLLANCLEVITTLKLSKDLMPILQIIIEAQERKDYLYVADLLQYELAPMLGECA